MAGGRLLLTPTVPRGLKMRFWLDLILSNMPAWWIDEGIRLGQRAWDLFCDGHFITMIIY